MAVKAKKIPYFLLLLLLVPGASLIIGLMSFGGTLAVLTSLPWILPVALPLALLAFGLAVAYEGEIYLQNLKGAFNKLFLKSNYLKRRLANEFLQRYFPESAEGRPEFFDDYEKQLKLLSQFDQGFLSKERAKQRKLIVKKINQMEKYFAKQLFSAPFLAPLSPYQKELGKWLNSHGYIIRREWQERLQRRRNYYTAAKIFSLLTSVFMGLGTTYLLGEAFAAIPFLAAIPLATLPFIILPMAILAGIAYGFLIYNAITDMVNNNTFRKWYDKIRNDLRREISFKTVFFAALALSILALNIALTVCTAGTWWTVAKNTKPIFEWMIKIPGFVMGVLNPLITGISALIFNLENTSETLEFIVDATKTKRHFWRNLVNNTQEWFSTLRSKENWGQILNPFRILLKITVTPLRIILFLGHLVSIGVTADRMPGIPEIASALLGIISEGFEDMHYFFGHSHEGHTHSTRDLIKERLEESHGHDHSSDLPTKLVKFLFAPLYLLATLWDWGASRWATERPNLSFKGAWTKQTGKAKEAQEYAPLQEVAQPSDAWEADKIVFYIEEYLRKRFPRASQHEKKDALIEFAKKIQSETPNPAKLATCIQKEAHDNKAIYNKHRYFAWSKNTRTQDFLEKELVSKVGRSC